MSRVQWHDDDDESAGFLTAEFRREWSGVAGLPVGVEWLSGRRQSCKKKIPWLKAVVGGREPCPQTPLQPVLATRSWLRVATRKPQCGRSEAAVL